MNSIKANRVEMATTRGGLFGEFGQTGVGSDLTLEWDSTDPDLHSTAGQDLSADAKEAATAASDDEDRYRHFHQVGLPDA